jgi:hypothetical protein
MTIMLDTDDATLRVLANRDWSAGFDGKALPGRIATMKQGENMRKVLKAAGTVLGQSRVELTYALQQMRKTRTDRQREQAILDAIEGGLEWLDAQRAMLIEARERMRIADARLALIKRDCAEEG